MDSLQSDLADKGTENLYNFLFRTRFLGMMADKNGFQDWIKDLTFLDFRDYLTRINGLIRQVHTKDRRINRENVHIGNDRFGIQYVPPQLSDKDELLEKSFTVAKQLSPKSAGLLLYYSLQAIHPFLDGNGRTGRLLYLLLEKAELGEVLGKKELEEFLEHYEDFRPGRTKFANRVIPHDKVRRAVRPLFAREVLGGEVSRNYERIFSGLQGGVIDEFTNEEMSRNVEGRLRYLMSEGGGGAFPFRDIVLVKYLQSRGLLERYTVRADKENVLRFDGKKVLETLSEEDALEIIGMDLRLKKLFVDTLLDTVADTEKFKAIEKVVENEKNIAVENEKNIANAAKVRRLWVSLQESYRIYLRTMNVMPQKTQHTLNQLHFLESLERELKSLNASELRKLKTGYLLPVITQKVNPDNDGTTVDPLMIEFEFKYSRWRKAYQKEVSLAEEGALKTLIAKM